MGHLFLEELMERFEIDGVLLGTYRCQILLRMDGEVGVIAFVGEEWGNTSGGIIAGVQSFSCPVCLATYKQLEEHECLGVRRGEIILSALKDVCRNFPSASVYEFRQEVKKLGLGLSGLFEEPCWEGLGIEPYVFIKQDILHGIHKFVWDHPSEWLKKMLGVQEMDCRFIAQPPISTDQFRKGYLKTLPDNQAGASCFPEGHPPYNCWP
jgi:hypothetical protein